MATTYQLIASATPSGVNSTTFSSIPSTYTDLVIRASTRSDVASYTSSLQIVLNGDTASNYNFDAMNADPVNATITSQAITGTNNMYIRWINAASSTASTFAPTEIIFPQYSSTSFTKQAYSTSYQSNNQTIGLNTMAQYTNWWNSTAAINSMQISLQSGNFVSGSRLDLYGIKKG